MTDELIELARVGYEAYCASVGGVAFNGDRLPDFDAVPEHIWAAWVAAAAAVKEAAR